MGQPSLAIANFTWTGFAGHPGMQAAAPDLVRGFAPLCENDPGAGAAILRRLSVTDVRPLPLVAGGRRGGARTARAPALRDRPAVLLSFGDTVASLNLSTLDCLSRWTVVTTDRIAPHSRDSMRCHLRSRRVVSIHRFRYEPRRRGGRRLTKRIRHHRGPSRPGQPCSTPHVARSRYDQLVATCRKFMPPVHRSAKLFNGHVRAAVEEAAEPAGTWANGAEARPIGVALVRPARRPAGSHTLWRAHRAQLSVQSSSGRGTTAQSAAGTRGMREVVTSTRPNVSQALKECAATRSAGGERRPDHVIDGPDVAHRESSQMLGRRARRRPAGGYSRRTRLVSRRARRRPEPVDDGTK